MHGVQETGKQTSQTRTVHETAIFLKGQTVRLTKDGVSSGTAVENLLSATEKTGTARVRHGRAYLGKLGDSSSARLQLPGDSSYLLLALAGTPTRASLPDGCSSLAGLGNSPTR